MGAIAAANANGLIHPDGPLAQDTPQQGLLARRHRSESAGGRGPGEAGISVRNWAGAEGGHHRSGPAGYHQFNRAIEAIALLCHLKALGYRGAEDRAQRIALIEQGQEALHRHRLLP